MNRAIKKYEKYLSPHHYLAVLRRAPVHMQHAYAALFAGVITTILTSVVLYFDYGFWHDKYNRDEVVETQTTGDPLVTVKSPGEMIGSFFKEAGDKIKTINVSSSTLPTGKENYTREENTAGGQ
jgi:hypothetical protein